MEPSTYSEHLALKAKAPKKFNTLSSKELSWRHEIRISAPEVDALVHRVGPCPELTSAGKPKFKRPVWEDACRWACKAWKTLWIALVARKKESFRTSHAVTADPAQDFIRKYALYYCEGKAIKWLKFHTTYIFAHATHNEVPAAPYEEPNMKPGILASGWVYRRCQSIMRGGSKNLPAAVDLLQSKFGMPKAPRNFIEETLEKHKKAFLTKFSEPENPFSEDGERMIELKEKVEKLVSRFFPETFKESWIFPKPSSCFERNTKNGGQMMELMSGFYKTLDEVYWPFVKLGEHDTELVSMWLKGPDQVVEVRHSFSTALLVLWKKYIDGIWKSRLDEPLFAKQFPITEPLKVRVILMAQAAEMYRCTSLQKFMHSTLKKVPAFRFIGEPDTTEDIEEFFNYLPLDSDEEFVSGDYDAATDNIRAELSTWTWDCICRRCNIDDDLKSLGHKCLTRHLLHDPKGNCLGSQQNGQSMGSPMSFPILCLVNAACFLAAGNFEVEYLTDGPIRINGDDIVFRSEKCFYDKFWKFARTAGFNPSKGKNYRSSEFLMINSHLYELHNGHFRNLKIVNTAICQDLVRKGIYAGEPTGVPYYLQEPNFHHLTHGHRDEVALFLRDVFLDHVPIPTGVAPDLGRYCGGPGFLLGEPSLLARVQTSIWFTNGRPDFKKSERRPEDTSWAGSIAKEVLSSRTERTMVSCCTDDPLLDASWRRSEGPICAGDLLDEVLRTLSFCEECPDSAATARSTVFFPDRDIFEGESAFKKPSFLAKVTRVGDSLSRFYERGFRRCYPSIKKDHFYCTVQPTDSEKSELFRGNWRVHSVLHGMRVTKDLIDPFALPTVFGLGPFLYRLSTKWCGDTRINYIGSPCEENLLDDSVSRVVKDSTTISAPYDEATIQALLHFGED